MMSEGIARRSLSVLNIKKVMRADYEFLLRKGDMTHEALVFLRNQIDRLSAEINELERSCFAARA